MIGGDSAVELGDVFGTAGGGLEVRMARSGRGGGLEVRAIGNRGPALGRPSTPGSSRRSAELSSSTSPPRLCSSTLSSGMSTELLISSEGSSSRTGRSPVGERAGPMSTEGPFRVEGSGGGMLDFPWGHRSRSLIGDVGRAAGRGGPLAPPTPAGLGVSAGSTLGFLSWLTVGANCTPGAVMAPANLLARPGRALRPPSRPFRLPLREGPPRKRRVLRRWCARRR